MARTIYDKPTRTLLKDMLNDMGLKPGQVFTTSRAIEWFKQHYPKLQPGSIRAHLVQASTNDRSRLRRQTIALQRIGAGHGGITTHALCSRQHSHRGAGSALAE